MALNLSPPVRIAAICGLVFAVVVGGGLKFLGGGEAAVTPHALNPHPFGIERGAKEKPKAATAKPKQHAAAKAKPKAAPAYNRAAVSAALAAGLPAPVAAALGRNRLVVVSLYDPYSEVDGIAFAEARAGAGLAGAAFVPLNVLSQAQAGKLTEKYGLLPDPGVLVFVRPSTLLVKISGFADKETVAQAAHNAANGT